MLACGFSFSVWKTVGTENLLPVPVLVWHFLFQTSQSYVRESREGSHYKSGNTCSAICYVKKAAHSLLILNM